VTAARKQRSQPAGPKALTGSDEAKRRATVILEAMCGLRTTQSAADELHIALVRYYVLETRMMQAMIDGLEPRARGRKRDLGADLTKLRSENQRLEGEVLRLKALHRVTQKAVCVRPDKVAKSKDGKPQQKRRVRKKSRGERVLATLKASAPEESPQTPASLPSPSAKVAANPNEGVA
jgi:hypothetical protein